MFFLNLNVFSQSYRTDRVHPARRRPATAIPIRIHQVRQAPARAQVAAAAARAAHPASRRTRKNAPRRRVNRITSKKPTSHRSD